jgi:hypothetical protein
MRSSLTLQPVLCALSACAGVACAVVSELNYCISDCCSYDETSLALLTGLGAFDEARNNVLESACSIVASPDLVVWLLCFISSKQSSNCSDSNTAFNQSAHMIGNLMHACIGIASASSMRN